MEKRRIESAKFHNTVLKHRVHLQGEQLNLAKALFPLPATDPIHRAVIAAVEEAGVQLDILAAVSAAQLAAMLGTGTDTQQRIDELTAVSSTYKHHAQSE